MVRPADNLSMRARLRISILTLVTTIVCALSLLTLRGVIGGTLDQAGVRGRIVGEAVQGCLVDARELDFIPKAPMLRRILDRSLDQDATISNVLIVDPHQNVIASARPWAPHPVDEWSDWQRHDVFLRSMDLLRATDDVALTVNSGANSPYQVRVLFSPERLRAAIWPHLRDIAVLSVLSLLVSALLAMLVSRVVGNSLGKLGQKIDQITEGNVTPGRGEEFSDLPELATLETKLSWLGRQFSGARTDILRLKSNVEIMMRQLDEAVLVFGADNRLQMAGEPAQRLLAKAPEDLIGQTAQDVFPKWTAAGNVLSRAFATRQRVHEQPVLFERSNLPPQHLLMTVEPVDYGDNAGTGMLVAFRNSDTRQKLRADLDTARRLSAISRITSGVAHEIKNPLNAMMLHLQIAQDKLGGGRGDAKPELEILGRELWRLDRVVKTLLDFHRPMEPKLADCDLQDLAADVAALIRPQAEAQGVRVMVESDVEKPIVLGDADLLKQGLLNVAVNGLEAMKDGGLLRFCVSQSGSEYTLSVLDQGQGIPPEIRDRIFNLYFTTKKSTGIGLAMTYRIVLMHSGTISVDSEIGKGTCFRLGLPAPVRSEVAPLPAELLLKRQA